jgi:HK97 family phage major capsid protein
MSRTLSIISNQMEALQANFRELDALSSLDRPTEQQKNRMSYLYSVQATLRQGVSEQTINRALLAKLKREIGLHEDANIDQLRVSNPAMLSEWRNLVHTERQLFRADEEYRDVDTGGNAVGSQSISYTSGGTGGYFVPQEYDSRLFQSLAQYDQILDSVNCNVIQTLTGRPMTTPSVDDATGSPAAMQQSFIVNESTQVTEAGIVAGKLSWQATPKFSTGIVRVSRELFDDAFEPIAAILERVFAQRHALAMGFYAIQGNGSGQPQGLVTALPASTVVTSATSTLALTDFEAVYAQLPQVYRGQAKWYMSDSVRNVVTKLLETAGRPMIGPAEYLLGKQIVICESMAVAGAGNAAVAVLASPNYLLQRRVAGSTITVTKERYADYGQWGFQSFSRFDAQPMLFNSAFPPVASLNQHS